MTIPWYEALFRQREEPSAGFEFTERFLSATDAERAEILKVWDPEETWSWTLPNSWRLACKSEHPGTCRERIRLTLLFDALGWTGEYWRESLIGLGVVFNSCLLAELDPLNTFQEIADAVPGPARDAIAAFASRAPEDQSMAAFGLTAVEDPGGGYEIKADWWMEGHFPGSWSAKVV